MSKKQTILLIGASLVTAILAHAFFLYQWTQGVYMAGPDDGLSQMVPFREMLYDQFTSGNFFYAYEFGLGGGTYSQLAYYYGINLFFYITVAAVFLLESLSLIGEPDVLFWAQATVFISIARMTIILMVSTYVFRYLNGRILHSFIGAVLYGVSAMYFRNVTFWEFFGDAFLWLPLLILGVEKIIREQKPGWLIAATAISFFDNFYFAYINGIFTGMYIFARWIFPLAAKETPKRKQLNYYIGAVLLGLGIGSVGLVPAIWGFLQNIRPPFDQEIPFFSNTSNILYDSPYLIVPAVFVLMIGLLPLFKQPQFKLFTALSLLIIMLHYLPWAASFFNGLSAPQNRYEYLASFTIGGAVAAGLPVLKKVTQRQMMAAGIGMIAFYFVFHLADSTLEFASQWTAVIPVTAGVVLLLFFLVIKNGKTARHSLIAVIVLSQLVVINQYQYDKLYVHGGLQDTTKEYIQSEKYSGAEQQKLINEVLNADSSPLSRVSWKADGRYNTPIIQGFTGTSAYSSILNGHLLDYYYHDLEIDMKRESVSRYSGFGDRANLHSLWQGNYVMYKKGDAANIPYGFEAYKESENYIVYKNTNPLPFVRVSDQIYSEKALKDNHPISREQAMLKGLVVKGATATAGPIPEKENLIDQTTSESVGSTYSEGRLVINEKKGGLDISLPQSVMESGAEDIYVSFYLFNNVEEAPLFALQVNDFWTTRKSRESFYKTNVNDITIRIPKEEVISIRMRKGDYTLKDLEIYTADYQALEKAAKREQTNTQPEVTLDGNRISIKDLQVTKDGYLAIPVPYEKGWQVKVDREKRDVEKVNYAMLGTAIQPGDETVEFTYLPPYFKTTLIIAVVSILLACLWVRRKRD
ncbi:YfhO family protein [Thalassobacillus devorans]|uniref:YfhO family protein n=1 Tax=Thalassobacillus devorans TaxID=279813 RepID=UPI00048A8100|nr:YfhO family protein [Thalassobacillus devorans]